MKKFTLKAIALATASVCGSAAFAGSITAPATTVKYAVESMLSTTDITLPTVTYRMGVDRTTAQDFTVIITPKAGTTFLPASCTTAIPPTAVVAGGAAGASTATLKRAGTLECAYEIDVTTAFVRGAGTIDLNFAGLVLDTHGLATNGNTETITIGLKDLGETAFIDNSATLTANVATSGNALTITATQDTATTTDVNHADGPLFGFVADGDDSASTAMASFNVNNNSGATTFMKPDGVTPWNFVVDGTAVNLTLTGNFDGMATGGLVADPSVGANPTVSGTGTTRTFSLVPANFAAAPSSTTVSVSFLSSETVSLGTSRTFGVAGVGDVITGADVTLAGNAAWWVWDANASQLMVPRMTTNVNYLSRFNLLNTGTASVGYSATCYSETGNTITYGTAKTGTLSGSGLTVVNAADICTFAGNARGSVIFTISAPINTVKGSYEAVDGKNFAFMMTPLVRPYNQANTTE